MWEKPDYTATLDRFEIYRSSDGLTFKLIQRIVNTPSITHYETMDILDAPGTYTYRNIAFYQDGCASEPVDTMIDVTDIDETATNAVSIYPNPTSGKVTIEAEQLRKVEIHNFLGQSLGNINADNDLVTLDLSSFGKGLYLLMIQTENGLVRQSVIVK